MEEMAYLLNHLERRQRSYNVYSSSVTAFNFYIKKAEHQTINAFELWCWSRLLGLLDCKEIKPVSPTGNWPWVFTGRTDAESEAPIILHLMQRAVSLKNDQDYADKIKAEVEGDDTGQNSWVVSLTQWTWVLGNSKIVEGSLAYYSPWGRKESDTT